MKTDVITVSSRGKRMREALDQAEKVAGYKGLSRRGTLHLRLLTEEMMGLMRSITGETEGSFWIEDEDGVYYLHLVVNTIMNSVKRGELLSASTSGKNESARGLIGRIRDIFDRGADEDVAAFSPPMMSEMLDQSSTPMLDMEWSMLQYEKELADRIDRKDPVAKAEKDELEKSVVARVADEVKVSIRGPQAEMIIIKKLS